MRSRLALFTGLAVWTTGEIQAGWQGAEWGKSPEEIASRMGAIATIDPGVPGDDLGGTLIVGNKGTYVAGELSFEALFYYDRGRLASVRLNLKSGTCARLRDSLKARYGAALREDQKSATWQDPTANNEVYVRFWGWRENDCFVSYSPLRPLSTPESKAL